MKESKFNLEDPKICSKLRSLVQNAPEVFSIEDEPAMGALCALRGLVFEFLHPDLDRLSPFFGIELSETRSDFKINFVESAQWGLGIILERSNGKNFEARHPDLHLILNQESFTASGFKRIVIFPLEISTRLKSLGFKAVIVRDWILQSALQRENAEALNYFICNEWEQDNVVASTQARLMCNFELPFFGTHDIVDHLFGLQRENFRASHSIAAKLFPTLFTLHQNRENANKEDLKLAYAVGVLLDDLYQPKFYGSRKHMSALKLLERALTTTSSNTRMNFKELSGEKLEAWISHTRVA